MQSNRGPLQEAVEAKKPVLLTDVAHLINEAKPAPVHIDALRELIGRAEDLIWFREKVKELLPESAEAINAAPGTSEKLHLFSEAFNRKYFPLDHYYVNEILPEAEQENETSPWTMLRNNIPCGMEGIGEDEMHQLWESYGHGTGLIAILGEDYELEYGDDSHEGIRVPWNEEALKHVSKETLLRIPRGGIPLTAVHQALRGTPLWGVAESLKRIQRNTGNVFLDISPGDEGYYDMMPEWSEENIEWLTGEWGKAQARRQLANAAEERLRSNPEGELNRILDFLLPRLEDPDVAEIYRMEKRNIDFPEDDWNGEDPPAPERNINKRQHLRYDMPSSSPKRPQPAPKRTSPYCTPRR